MIFENKNSYSSRKEKMIIFLCHKIDEETVFCSRKFIITLKKMIAKMIEIEASTKA